MDETLGPGSSEPSAAATADPAPLYTVVAPALPLATMSTQHQAASGFAPMFAPNAGVSYTYLPALYLGSATGPTTAPPSRAADPPPVAAAAAPAAVAVVVAPRPPEVAQPISVSPPEVSPSELIARALRESTFFDPEATQRSAAESLAASAVIAPPAAPFAALAGGEAGGTGPPTKSAMSLREAALDVAERRLSFGLAAIAVIATLMAIALFFVR